MIHRIIYWIREQIYELRKGNSGDWAWMSTKPTPLASMSRNLWRAADPSFTYYFLLMLSVVIATFGLLSNSAATIIGAMIVAPLMGPIIGIAFSIVLNNRRLLRRSLLGIATGCLMSVAVAFLITWLIGIETATTEMLARTSPTLLDLGVALAAGAAGSYAKSRRDVADALPGVAIAVALVPPLAVVGIGMGMRSADITQGSLLLFATNLVGIVFSGALVFLFQRYGSVAKAQRGLTIAVTALFALGIPLGLSFQDLVIRERTRSAVNRLIRQETLTFADRDIRRLTVQRRRRNLIVSIEVAALAGSISAQQIGLVQEFLEEELDRPLSLNVTVVPVEVFNAPTR